MFRVVSSENVHECAIFDAGVLWGVKSDRNSRIEDGVHKCDWSGENDQFYAEFVK